MTAPRPDHFLDQAERLAASPGPGSPRQADLRPAISTAYYGVFHFLIASVANELVGSRHQSTARYRLVYRSIDHSTIRAICNDASKRPLPARYAGLLTSAGFGIDIRRFSLSPVELQQKRHRADYDPMPRFNSGDARVAIGTARGAIAAFQAAPTAERRLFLTLLVCPPRG